MFQNFKIHNLGFLLLGSGFLGALNVFILSLPGVGKGVWLQSEFAVSGLHFCAALCAAGFFMIGWNHRKLAMSALLHPLVVIPFLIALLSLCLVPFHILKVRDFLGSPQSGEGIVWWIDWGMLTASALFLWRFKIWRWILASTAFLSFAVTAGLTLSYMHFGFRITPYNYPDFLAFNLMCLVPLLTGLLQTRNPAIWAGLSIIFYAVLYLTQNQIAIAFGVIGIPFFIVLGFVFRENERVKMGLAYLTLAALPFVALASIFILIYLAGSGGFYEFHKLEHFRNILSRGYMMQIGLQPLIENPVTILTGTGWGSFTEHVVQYLPTGWFDFTQEGTKQWEGVSWDQFHTHDAFIDTLFSAGVGAAALLLSYFLLIPAYAKRTQKWMAVIFSAFLVSVVSFWFLFPINVPFIALAIGAMGEKSAVIKFSQRTRLSFFWVLPSMIIIQLMTVAMHLQTVKATHYYDPQELSIHEINENCPMDYYDAGAGGLHLARILVARIRALNYLADDEEREEKTDPKVLKTSLLKLNHVYCQTERYRKGHNAVSNRLLVAQLLVQGEVLLGMDFLDEETIEFYAKDWKANLESWLSKMPARTDQAVPFLLWHFVHGQENEAKEIATLIYSKDPNDPVGLWFTGLSLTAKPETAQEGLFRMRKGLEHGIERYMPVEDSIKEQL